jgi:hypothetical protein
MEEIRLSWLEERKVNLLHPPSSASSYSSSTFHNPTEPSQSNQNSIVYPANPRRKVNVVLFFRCILSAFFILLSSSRSKRRLSVVTKEQP